MTEISPQASAYQGLLYSVFQSRTDRRETKGLAVAFSAAHPGAGTSYLASALVSELNQSRPHEAVLLDCRDLAHARGPTRLLEGYPAQEREALQESIAALDQLPGSWRGSREYRTALLEIFRKRFRFVLVDCPSLKETPDIIGLAPLVDGVILVVEANVTNKPQVAYLERTIEGAGGKVLGNLLNKRTYAIPEPIHKRLEKLGI